jgi:hypothetical protein
LLSAQHTTPARNQEDRRSFAAESMEKRDARLNLDHAALIMRD